MTRSHDLTAHAADTEERRPTFQRTLRTDLDVEPRLPGTLDDEIVEEVAGYIDRSGVVPFLSIEMDSKVGRRRCLSIKALLALMLMNGIRSGHRARITDITKMFRRMTESQLEFLDVELDLLPEECFNLYQRVDYLFNKLADTLEEGYWAPIDDRGQPLEDVPAGADHVDVVFVDDTWFANRIITCVLEPGDIVTTSRALDGTDIETYGRLHSADDADHIRVDGGAEESLDLNADSVRTTRDEKPKAAILGYGEDDGRPIYTHDPDARGGYRTATSNRKGGTYVGYEIHHVVQTTDVTWTDGRCKASTTKGPVPQVVTNVAVAPAGSHRADAIVPTLVEAKRRSRLTGRGVDGDIVSDGRDIDDIVCDPGYSLCRPETLFWPLNDAGVHITYQVASHQRKVVPLDDNWVLINDHPFLRSVPAKDLPLPPVGSNAHQRRPYRDKSDLLMPWAARWHGWQDDSNPRMRNPVHGKFAWSEDVPESQRWKRGRKRIDVPDPDNLTRTFTRTDAMRDKAPRLSRYITGTSIHDLAYYSRRQTVEGLNGASKGGHVNVNAGRWHCVFGLTKVTILLAFAIAGLNLRHATSFRRKRDLAAESDAHAQGRPGGPAPATGDDGDDQDDPSTDADAHPAGGADGSTDPPS